MNHRTVTDHSLRSGIVALEARDGYGILPSGLAESLSGLLQSAPNITESQLRVALHLFVLAVGHAIDGARAGIEGLPREACPFGPPVLSPSSNEELWASCWHHGWCRGSSEYERQLRPTKPEGEPFTLPVLQSSKFKLKFRKLNQETQQAVRRAVGYAATEAVTWRKTQDRDPIYAEAHDGQVCVEVQYHFDGTRILLTDLRSVGSLTLDL